MPSNTTTSVQSNETFSTGGAVSLATGVLNTSTWSTGVGMNYAEITTQVTGAPASFTILLEGSVDGGASWVTIATCSNTAGETQFSTGLIQFTSLRARCSAVSGGTSPTINCVVTASQTPFTVTSGGVGNASTVTVVNPIDGNGNVKVSQQGAVVDAQTSNRYQSVSSTGTTTAGPSAGTVIASVAVFDFYYKVDVEVGFGATAESTTADNFILKAGGTTLYTLPTVNLASTQSRQLTFYVNPGGAVNLTVNVGGTAGSVGSIYKATVTATRLV